MSASPLLNVVLSLKSLWWFGHVLTLASSLRFYLSFSSTAYTWALLGVLTSYGCILYKSYARAAVTVENVWRAMRDENLHYLILGAMWLVLADVCFAALVPYATFSVFHAVTYAATTILPAVLLSPTPEADGQDADPDMPEEDTRHVLVTALDRADAFLRRYYTAAIEQTSTWEITAIPASLFLSVITLQGGLVPLACYCAFLYTRYKYSPVTRAVCARTREWLDGRLLSGRVPPAVENGYVLFKDLLGKVAPKVPGDGAQTPSRRRQH